MSNKGLGPGIFGQTLPADGRRYTIAIPEQYDELNPVPLIIALHWGGPVTPYYGHAILAGLVEPALKKLGAIIVAPDCNAGTWTNEQSESEILSLCEYIQGNYLIDVAKIMLTGYSLGGIGTWYMAARHQDRFAAAVPMAAKPPSGVLNVDWHIPLFVIHGQQDELFPVQETKKITKQLQKTGIDVKLLVLDGVTHYETGFFIEPLRKAVPWIETAWSV